MAELFETGSGVLFWLFVLVCVIWSPWAIGEIYRLMVPRDDS